MKLWATLLFTLFWSFGDNNPQQVVAHTFPVLQNITTIKTELQGDIEWKYWEEDFIKVETTISSNTTAEGLEYARSKGHFELLTALDDRQTLRIVSKRINTQIFVKGQVQETRQQHYIFVPRHLEYIYP